MRKVNLASFLAQSKHAAEWQRKTLNAARAAGYDVFQDCVMIDQRKIELNSECISEWARNKLEIDILIFEHWQNEDRVRIRRENAAIARAAVEAGMVPTEQESDMERDHR